MREPGRVAFVSKFQSYTATSLFVLTFSINSSEPFQFPSSVNRKKEETEKRMNNSGFLLVSMTNNPQ